MLVKIGQWVIALAVISVCSIVVARGWDIVRFSIADSVVDAVLGPDESQVEAVRPWLDVSGLRFATRASFLTVVRDPDAQIKARKRRDELIEILSIKPLSSKHWLFLSEIHFVTGEQPNKIEEAFRMSALTGPNEGGIMSRRALFGVAQWEVLPADLQKRTAADLIANQIPLSNNQITWLRQQLAQKTDAVRKEIQTALLAQGSTLKAIADIGL
jgi:hypothetical protein